MARSRSRTSSRTRSRTSTSTSTSTRVPSTTRRPRTAALDRGHRDRRDARLRRPLPDRRNRRAGADPRPAPGDRPARERQWPAAVPPALAALLRTRPAPASWTRSARGGRPTVRFAAVGPVSTEQILHPDKYRARERPLRVRPLPRPGPGLEERRIGDDRRVRHRRADPDAPTRRFARRARPRAGAGAATTCGGETAAPCWRSHGAGTPSATRPSSPPPCRATSSRRSTDVPAGGGASGPTRPPRDRADGIGSLAVPRTFVHRERVRFGDLDAMRHLNNVVFLRYFETARIAFMRDLFPKHDPAHPEHSKSGPDLRRVPHQLPLAGALRRGGRDRMCGRRDPPLGVPDALHDDRRRPARRGRLRLAGRLRLRDAAVGAAAGAAARGARGRAAT